MSVENVINHHTATEPGLKTDERTSPTAYMDSTNAVWHNDIDEPGERCEDATDFATMEDEE